jgi:hypothetical protein
MDGNYLLRLGGSMEAQKSLLQRFRCRQRMQCVGVMRTP